MPNNSNARPGNRSRVRPRPRHRRPASLTAAQRSRGAGVNLTAALAVAGQTTKVDLIYDAPVVTRAAADKPSGSITATKTGGAYTRQLSSIDQTAPNVVRATMSGVMSASTLFSIVQSENFGGIVPAAGRFIGLTAVLDT